MRKAFSETLTRVAEADERLLFVTGDLGFQVFDEFARRFGPRFVNAGVAEAQMINFAAGLAAEGWRPVAYSIASFATARPFEQIRYCVSYPGLPVVVVGAGRGLTYATSGVSHHALDDVALMSSLPNMTVVLPGDPGEIEVLFPQLMTLSGPSYFSVGRFGEPRYEAEEPAVLGRARKLRSGVKIAILTSGEAAQEALAAVELLRPDAITPAVHQFHTVKPLDVAQLDALVEQGYRLLVVEEHLPQGGLWAAIAQWNMGRRVPVRMERLGPPDQFALGNLRRETFRERMGFDARAIAGLCRRLWFGAH